MNSIRKKILEYLGRQPHEWVFGGLIEDHIRGTEGSKASNASRRCRELADEGLIESRIVKIESGGKSLRVVQYKYKFIMDQMIVQGVESRQVGSLFTS